MLWFFLFLHYFPTLSFSQCLPTPPNCQVCSPSYYDSNFQTNSQLSFSSGQPATCLPKNLSISYNRKILITNTGSCLLEDISGFDACYESLLTAFQTESQNMLIFMNGTIEFLLSSGQHLVESSDLKSINSEFFRQMQYEIAVSAHNRSENVVLSLLCNNFYIFAAGNLTLSNIDVNFEGINGTNSISSAIAPVNEGFGLFNVENQFNKTENAFLTIKNCNFYAFSSFLTDRNGWYKLFLLIGGKLTIQSTSFKNMSLPLGILAIIFDFYPNFEENSNNERGLILNNSIFAAIYTISAIFRFLDNWNTSVVVNNSVFQELFSNNGLFVADCLNGIFFFNCSFIHFNETAILLAMNTNSIFMDWVYFSKIVSNNNYFLYFEGVASDIAMDSLNIEDCQLQVGFYLINCANFRLVSSFLDSLKLENSLFDCLSSEISIYNSTFLNISSLSSLFLIQKSNYSSIEASYFDVIAIFESFFRTSNSVFFNLYRVMIKKSSATNIFELSDLDHNINRELQIINNSIVNIFSSDHTCVEAEFNYTQVESNSIESSIFSVFTLPNAYFLSNGSFFLCNNFTAAQFMFSMLVGEILFNNTVLQSLYFLDSAAYQYAFDFETTNEFYMYGCYLEDIGVIEKKTFYLSIDDNNVLLSFWTIGISIISNCTFVISSKIDLPTGIIEAIPHSGYFSSTDTNFIIYDTNPDFNYKGILLDHFQEALFINNRFYNMRCNSQTFYDSLGGVVLGASISLSYSKNNYVLLLANNIFIGCQCDKGGALAIVSICTVNMTNNTFLNSIANDFAGHLLIVGGETLNIRNLTLRNSVSGNGGAFYLSIFTFTSIQGLSVNSSSATAKGTIFLKDLTFCEINDSVITNSNVWVNGGFLYIFQSTVHLTNCRISNVSSVLDGGVIYLQQSSSLILENVTMDSCYSETGAGGGIYFGDAVLGHLNNTEFMSCGAFLQGGVLFFDVIQDFVAQDVRVYNSSAGNGVIFVKTESEESIFMFQSLILNSSWTNEGACFYYLAASLLEINGMRVLNGKNMSIYVSWSFLIDIVINNLELNGNIPGSGSLLFIEGVSLNAFGWELNGNLGTGNLIVMSDIIANLSNIIITKSSGNFLFNLENSDFQSTGLQLVNNSASSCYISLLQATDSSSIDIRQWNIATNIASNNSNCFFAIEKSKLSVENSTFKDNLGLIFNLISSNLSIVSSLFVNNSHFASGFSESNEVSIENSDFVIINNSVFVVSNDFAIDMVAVVSFMVASSFYLEKTDNSMAYSIKTTDPSLIYLHSTSFSNFTSGTLLIYNTNPDSALITIVSCFFGNNTANIGSTGYISGNFIVSIDNSIFKSNKALNSSIINGVSGVAACIFFQCFQSNLCAFDINSSLFEDNYASLLAPTVFSQLELNSWNNSFVNNYEGLKLSETFFSYPLRVVSLNDSPIPIVSGESFSLHFTMLDHFNQTLWFDNATILTLKPSLSSATLSSSVTIQNSLSQTKFGKISFSGTNILAKPDSNISVTISGIFAGLIDVSQLNAFSFDQTIIFAVRKCLTGEIILSDKSCFLCQKGTYSFDDPMITPQKFQRCTPCPENSFCYSGKYVFPTPGYYRQYNISLNAAPCENSLACIGSPFDATSGYNSSAFIQEIQLGIDVSNYSLGMCMQGNTGPLCYYCEYGYGRSSNNDYCKQCASLNVLIYVRLAFFILVLILYILLNFHFAESSHTQKKSSYANISTFFKIIVNHSQHITIILASSGEFPLPSVSNVFIITGYFSFSDDHVMSNDCLIQKVYYQRELMVIFKEVFNTLLPIVFSLTSFGLWMLINSSFNIFAICPRLRQQMPNTIKSFLNKILLFLMLSVFIFYSLILKSCFGLFNCIHIDLSENKTYLMESPDILCWGDEHLKYVLFYGLPGLLIWGVIFPFFLFLVLRRNSNIISFAEKNGLSDYVSPRKNDLSEKKTAKVTNFSKYLDQNEEEPHDRQENEQIFVKIHAEIIPESANQVKELVNQLVYKERNSKELKKLKTQTQRQKFMSTILSNIEHSRIFVFFYKDFKPNCYFWECLIFFRKFILTFLSSMTQSMSLEIECFLMYGILFWFLGATLRKRPYKIKKANYLEIFSLIVCQNTVFSTLVFQSNVREWFLNAVAVVCLLLNIAFFVIVGVWVLMDLFIMIKEKKKNNTVGAEERKDKRGVVFHKNKIHMLHSKEVPFEKFRK